MLSALKKAEDRDELIMRIFNPDEQHCGEGMVACTLPVVGWMETGMDENPLQQQSERAGHFARLQPCQSRTFSLAPDRSR
jgi:mannosylglycerate hydrolase